MNHNAQKILFIEFAEIKQGDGKGPKFEAGKAYWLSPDQAERWKAEGVAEDAPREMPPENEPVLTLRADDVRLARAGRGRYDVLGPNDMKFNDAPLSAHDAELLRKRVLEQGPPTRFVDPGDAHSIQFRQHDIDGVKTVSVAADWPTRALVAAGFLDEVAGQSDIATVDGDRLLIVVANGHAEYRRLGDTRHGHVIYDLIAGDYRAYEPPEPPQQSGFDHVNPTGPAEPSV